MPGRDRRSSMTDELAGLVEANDGARRSRRRARPPPRLRTRRSSRLQTRRSCRESVERHQSSFAPIRHQRGRGRIGRRCGRLPGAWVETGHAALPGPGPNRGSNPLPHEPKHRENPLPRLGASTTRPPWPVDPEPAPPAGGHTARRSVQRGPLSAVLQRRQTTDDRRQTSRAYRWFRAHRSAAAAVSRQC